MKSWGLALALIVTASPALAQSSVGNLRVERALGELAGVAATARTNLGLGSLSTQNSTAVSVSGGTVTGAFVTGAKTTADYSTNTAATGNLILDRVLTPKEYGAACDGVTDDTTAFRNMNTALNVVHGGTILLPPNVQCVVNTGAGPFFGPSFGINIRGAAPLTNASPNAPYSSGYGLLTSQLILGNAGGVTTTAAQAAPSGAWGVYFSPGVAPTQYGPFVSPAAAPGAIGIRLAGMLSGMTITGAGGLASGVTDSAFSGTTVTLSAANTGDVPLGSVLTFTKAGTFVTAAAVASGAVYIPFIGVSQPSVAPLDVLSGSGCIQTGTQALKVGSGIQLSLPTTCSISSGVSLTITRTFNLTSTVDSPSGATAITFLTTNTLDILSLGTIAAISQGDTIGFGGFGLQISYGNLSNLVITRSGLPGTAPTTLTAAQAEFQNWPNVGSGVLLGDAATMDRVSIIGFNVGLTISRSYEQRVEDVNIDANTGVEVGPSADFYWLSHIHVGSFWDLNLGAQLAASVRYGPGFFFTNGNFDTKLDRFFANGHSAEFLFDGVANLECNSCFADGLIGASAPATTYGFEITGPSSNIFLNGGETQSNNYGVYVNTTSDVDPTTPNSQGLVDVHDFTATQTLNGYYYDQQGGLALTNVQVLAGGLSAPQTATPITVGAKATQVNIIAPYITGGSSGNAFAINAAAQGVVTRIGGFVSGWTDNVGPMVVSGATPTITSGFGTSPTIVGSQTSFRVTVGSGGAASGVLGFPSTWLNTPTCQVWDETTSNLMRPTPTTGALTITGTMVAADVIGASCSAY